MPTGTMTAQQAAVEVSNYQRAMTGSRYVPDLPDIFKEASEAARIFIFNVGPWPHVREMGSCGIQRIPACPDGKEYSEPIVIEGAEAEPYPINEIECAMKPKAGKPGQLGGAGDGYLYAQQIIGEGPHVPRSSSFVPFGVFISRSNPPAKADLAKAKQVLEAKYLELVRYANEQWGKGPAFQADILNRPEWYFVAARKLGKTEIDCPFLQNSVAPAERAACGNCGKVYEIGIAMCSGCGSILDEEKYIAEARRKAAILKKLEQPEVKPVTGANALIK
jgi:hypothetical protein